MKISPLSLLLIPLSALLASCANITFIGHERAYDINAQLKPDLSAPVCMNAGFESKSGLAVPPETSQPMSDLFNSVNLPKGDVLPTISKLEVTRVPASDALGKAASINYVSVIATGKAAVIATSAAPAAAAATLDPNSPAASTASTGPAAEVLDAMKTISNSGATPQ